MIYKICTVIIYKKINKQKNNNLPFENEIENKKIEEKEEEKSPSKKKRKKKTP